MATTINGSSGVTTNSGAVYDGLQRDTVKTATGTAVDFTGIPSWVKRLTVMLDGVSTSGTSNLAIQIGDSGGLENTGYASYSCILGATSLTSGSFNATAFRAQIQTAASALCGAFTLTNMSGNTWVANGILADSGGSNGIPVTGSKTLSAQLDRIRITTANGTDTFDAGTINIMYE